MMLTWLMSSYPALGLAGSLVILTGALVPALFYRGKEGEHYSVTRHFISELGNWESRGWPWSLMVPSSSRGCYFF